MEFWQWYWSGIKRTFTLRWVRHPVVEYFFAVAGTVGLGTGLSIIFTPLWLILIVPIGVTAAIHRLWRWKE